MHWATRGFTLKFGLYGLHKGDNVSRDTLAQRACRAERGGFESLWIGDHIALPLDAPDPADEPRLEAVVAVSHLAAVTDTVGLAFGVIVLPQRQPVLLAKQISSIDALAEGRLTVGVGVGYLEAELQAMGATLADRGARTDEYLDAMLALWGEGAASFDGSFVSFVEVMQTPRPVQQPHPSLVIGGNSAAAMRRAVRVASGWFGWGLTPGEAADAVTRLHEIQASDERRPAPGEIEITITPSAEVDYDLACRYAEAGVDRLVLEPPTSVGSAMDDLIAFAEETLIGRV
jgi:probable F420-dependent oxidoreductase